MQKDERWVVKKARKGVIFMVRMGEVGKAEEEGNKSRTTTWQLVVGAEDLNLRDNTEKLETMS